MGMLAVNSVVGRVVEATDDVTLDARGVVYEQVGDRGAVGYEICTDVGPTDFVLAVCVGARRNACDAAVANSASEDFAWNLRGGEGGRGPQGNS